jgi:ribosomal protein L22
MTEKMNKLETTRAIESAGSKIQKGIVRSPSDTDGIQQEVAKVKEEVKKEDKELKKLSEKKPAEKIKKDEAVVNGISLPISTKDSVAICRFIKGKTIEKAIADLEEVLKFKKAIPMKGEIPHRKGKGMMAGRYPVKPVKYFIIMLKNLRANAIVNGMEEGTITEAIPNRASRPYGRFGSVKRKRTHVKIKLKERKIKSQEKK